MTDSINTLNHSNSVRFKSERPQLHPAQIDQWFSSTQQRTYISALLERGGLTRRRAECFIRLWAYLLIKQQTEALGELNQPLTQLHPLSELIACTHREAAELFYGQQDRGSDRAAGMMIDRLVALGLLEKRFDGHTLCLRVRSLPELKMVALPNPPEVVKPQSDEFNPRTDAVPVANLIINHYAEIIKDTSIAAAKRKTINFLRKWAQQYPKCMRVLRRSDNLNPVGISILYPTALESEENFFLPPSRSFFLTQSGDEDPFKMALPGDTSCTSVYIRTWVIDAQYMQREYLCQFLEDSQQTLVHMQADFPNLCDLYSIVIHPMHEELRKALGFQKTCQDSQRSYHWIYLALDRFLQQDIQQALSGLTTSPSSAKG